MRLLIAYGFILFLIVGSTFFGCDILDDNDKEEPAPFSIQLINSQIEDAISSQRCVFLVSVSDEGSGNGKGNPVTISATVPSAEVIIENQLITLGQIAEVTVIPEVTFPSDDSNGTRKISFEEQEITPIQPNGEPTEITLEGTIYGKRSGLKEEVNISITVLKGEDLLNDFALEIRNKFIPWLAINYPELGITGDTEWSGTIVRPHFLVVSYYLFFSDDWEMGVNWHVTRPPDNWTRIYLRQRFTEMYPSYGFEISSWSTEGEEPHIIDTKDPIYNMSEVWR